MSRNFFYIFIGPRIYSKRLVPVNRPSIHLELPELRREYIGFLQSVTQRCVFAQV